VISALRAVYWRLAEQTDGKGSQPQPRPDDAGPPEEEVEEEAGDGRAGNALFLSFELEQLFEDLAVERAAPPPQGSSLLDGASG
jgi:hypothetical protein